jgi:hypothetical protein
MTNYRPILPLTAFSKVLEKIMYNMNRPINNILVPEQFRFREGISIENAAFTKNTCWRYSLFCDLTKCFDCVGLNPEILLAKLHLGYPRNYGKLVQMLSYR